MEELGIGRPSTYASILAVLKDRGYVRIDKKRLIPEDKGRIVVAFLESFFPHYVEYDFTAALEEQLDQVSNNELDWQELLRDFWDDFTAAVGEIKDLRITQVLDALNELLAPHIFPPRADGTDPRQCPTCGDGQLSLKLGKFGAFIGCSHYPECRYTRQLAAGENGSGSGGARVLGKDPETGLDVTLRSGRFGPYVQLGEGSQGREAETRRLAERTWRPTTSISKRRSACSRCRAKSASIRKTASRSSPASAASAPTCSTARPTPISKTGDDVLNIGLNRAVTLIAEKKLKPAQGPPLRPRARPRRSASIPTRAGRVVAKNGRYGPYVSHDGVNATITGDKTADDDHARRSGRADRCAHRQRRGGGRRWRKPKAPKAQGRKPRSAERAQSGKRAQSSERAKAAKSRRPPRPKRRRNRKPPRRENRGPQEGDAGTIAVEPAAARNRAPRRRPPRTQIRRKSRELTALRRIARPKVELPKNTTKHSTRSSLQGRACSPSFANASGKVGTREIARAFGLKNADRAELKRMLRDLADDGAVEQPPQEAASARRPAVRSRSPTSPGATATAN